MTELEKIEYAKTFIDKLANGINPLDDSIVPEAELVNNVRISRCFFYVSEILRQVIEKGGLTPTRIPIIKKSEFFLSDSARALLIPVNDNLTVSKVAAKINSVIDTNTTEKISAQTISKWLETSGFLESVKRWDGKKKRIPTALGRDLGIITEERSGEYGSYILVLFSPAVQQFIYDNIDAIINLKNEQSDPLTEFHARPWTEEHISTLTAMFRNGKSIPEMAYELKRTETGIRSRLKIIGLTE